MAIESEILHLCDLCINIPLITIGQYTCTVSSSDGYTHSVVVNLRVVEPAAVEYEPPRAQLSERLKSVNEDAGFALTCSVSGQPQPAVSWLFNGKPVDSLSLEGVYVSGPTLQVANARASLTGYFSCRASSTSPDGSVDSDEDTTLVRVVEAQRPDEENNNNKNNNNNNNDDFIVQVNALCKYSDPNFYSISLIMITRFLMAYVFLYLQKWFSSPSKMFFADQNYFSSIKYVLYRSKVCIVEQNCFSQTKSVFRRTKYLS